MHCIATIHFWTWTEPEEQKKRKSKATEDKRASDNSLDMEELQPAAYIKYGYTATQIKLLNSG